MDNRKIGVFDSGLGGLSVVREMQQLMAGESIVYFGDTARLPYGSKSKESIIGFSRQIMRFLMKHDVKAVIIACGTASSNALDVLKEEFDLPIMGVVEAGAKAAAERSETGRIGVLGTEATVKSGAFDKLIHKAEPEAVVTSQACPLFVPLVESGWFHDTVTTQVAERYMEPLKQAGVDTVVLGCTHYPLIADTIGQVMGKEVELINVSREAVLDMKKFLEESGMLADREKGEYEFYASDSTDHMQHFGESVLGLRRLKVEKVAIEKY